MAVKLAPGFQVVAIKIQESVLAMSHADIRSRLQDALSDTYQGTGNYCWLADVFGDDKDGECVFSCNGGLKKAPYTCSKSGATIDISQAVDVVPLTTYELESPDLTEAGARNSKRDASQIQAIHDASAGLGATCTAKESAKIPRETKEANDLADENGVRLVESAGIEPLKLIESGAINPLVKIISPGRGSSGYYTKELLERDGPKIFKRGTLMYINHATAAEEAARPEGDYSKLAAVTTGNAYWDQTGPDGPALYAPAKVFSGVAAEVAEKAPFTGVSIRASGQYAEAKGDGLTKKIAESKLAPDGKPGLIGKLTYADSIDLVTKAGRDGKLLLESANEGVEEMDKAEFQAMLNEALKPLHAENKRLNEHLELQKAPGMVQRLLVEVRLPDACKRQIIEKFSSESILSLLPFKEGALDEPEIKKLVEAEATRQSKLLMELGYNVNPAALGTPMSEADVTADIKVFEADKVKVAERLADIFVGEKTENKNRETARVAFINGRAA